MVWTLKRPESVQTEKVTLNGTVTAGNFVKFEAAGTVIAGTDTTTTKAGIAQEDGVSGDVISIWTKGRFYNATGAGATLKAGAKVAVASATTVDAGTTGDTVIGRVYGKDGAAAITSGGACELDLDAGQFATV